MHIVVLLLYLCVSLLDSEFACFFPLFSFYAVYSLALLFVDSSALLLYLFILAVSGPSFIAVFSSLF